MSLNTAEIRLLEAIDMAGRALNPLCALDSPLTAEEQKSEAERKIPDDQGEEVNFTPVLNYEPRINQTIMAVALLHGDGKSTDINMETALALYGVVGRTDPFAPDSPPISEQLIADTFGSEVLEKLQSIERNVHLLDEGGQIDNPQYHDAVAAIKLAELRTAIHTQHTAAARETTDPNTLAVYEDENAINDFDIRAYNEQASRAVASENVSPSMRTAYSQLTSLDEYAPGIMLQSLPILQDSTDISEYRYGVKGGCYSF